MKTLRSRLLLIFLLFTLFGLIQALVFRYFDARKARYAHTITLLSELQQLLLKSFLVFDDFVTHETVNGDYFSLGESVFLLKHQQLLMRSYQRLDSIGEQSANFALGLNPATNELRHLVQLYERQSNEMVSLIRQLGFKDHGVNGLMRQEIHLLENIRALDQIPVLMLRRHEKDFMLRAQDEYRQKHSALAEQFARSIAQSSLPSQQKQEAQQHLLSYTRHFDQLAGLETKLGLRSNSGLKLQLRSRQNEIQFALDDMHTAAQTAYLDTLHALHRYLWLFVLAMLLLGVVASLFFSRRIGKKISRITGHMREFVKSEFTANTPLEIEIHGDEVSQLAHNYLALRSEIIELIANFRQKVEQRTYEIQQQKERIELQASEIEAQRDHLLEKNQQIEQNNEAVLDSIRYAERIQQAVLPTHQQLQELFPEYFVLYRPRDIIGGDFYWARRLQSQGRDMSIVVLGDSTGHGVPGALMTMLGYAFLDEIILRYKVFQPAAILEQLRHKIIDSLNYKNNENRQLSDGMDAAICCLDHATQTLYFAGANRPLYLLRRGELHYFRGDASSVGRMVGSYKPYTEERIPWETGDQVYLFTDGFADQFGGNDSRKFMRKNIRQMLSTIQNYPLYYQKELVNETFDKWRGQEKQVDDVLCIGFRLP